MGAVNDKFVLRHLMAKSEDINFTLATNALDAGTKVYVNRVDAVHYEAQQVIPENFLTGL